MSVDRGVGECPKRDVGMGHVWKSWQVDPRRSCEFCGRPGRDNRDKNESGGFFAEATGARTAARALMQAPMESGTGDPRKAWPKGLPPLMTARAMQVREDIAAADRDHPWVEGPDGKLVRS